MKPRPYAIEVIGELAAGLEEKYDGAKIFQCHDIVALLRKLAEELEKDDDLRNLEIENCGTIRK